MAYMMTEVPPAPTVIPVVSAPGSPLNRSMKSFVGSIIAVVVGPALVYAGQAVLDNSGIIKTEILNVFNSLPTTGFVGMVVGAVKFFAYPAIVAGIAGAIAGVGRWLKNTGTDIKVV